MKNLAPSVTACVVVVCSCLLWVGGISMVVVMGLGFSVMTGWIVAGALCFSMAVGCSVILYEMRHAIDLTDYETDTEFEGLFGLPWCPEIPYPQAETC